MYPRGIHNTTNTATVFRKNNQKTTTAQTTVVSFKSIQSCLEILNPKIWARNAHNNQYLAVKGSFLLWTMVCPDPSLSLTRNLLRVTQLLCESDAFKPKGIAIISPRMWFCYLIFQIFVQGKSTSYLHSMLWRKAVFETAFSHVLVLQENHYGFT